MENEFEEESLSGVKASRTGLTLTHVMYVDYIVFFFFSQKLIEEKLQPSMIVLRSIAYGLDRWLIEQNQV